MCECAESIPLAAGQIGRRGVSDLRHRRCKGLFTGESERCVRFATLRCKELFTGALARCKELFTDGSERCVISATPRCKELFTGETVRCVRFATPEMDFFVLQTLIYYTISLQ